MSCRSTINTNKMLMEVIVDSFVYGREEEEDRMAVRMERCGVRCDIDIEVPRWRTLLLSRKTTCPEIHSIP